MTRIIFRARRASIIRACTAVNWRLNAPTQPSDSKWRLRPGKVGVGFLCYDPEPEVGVQSRTPLLDVGNLDGSNAVLSWGDRNRHGDKIWRKAGVEWKKKRLRQRWLAP